MKKIIALLLITVMCLSLVACSSNDDTDNQTNGGGVENNDGSTGDNTNENDSENGTENNNGTSDGTTDNVTDNENDNAEDDATDNGDENPIDPNSPEGRAIAELDKVKEYFTTHFVNNDKWYYEENDTNQWVEMTADGKFQCMYMGQPSRYWNFAWILESYKSDLGVDGTFSHSGDDVIYTLADESASVTWENIDAFDIDAYKQSDEYKEFLKQVQISSMKTELKQFSNVITVNLLTTNNNWEISSGVFVSKDENGNLTASSSTIADAFNLYRDEANLSGTFSMDGDTLVYNNEDGTISITWDEAVN